MPFLQFEDSVSRYASFVVSCAMINFTFASAQSGAGGKLNLKLFEHAHPAIIIAAKAEYKTENIIFIFAPMC